jgi:hypothetical protein
LGLNKKGNLLYKPLVTLLAILLVCFLSACIIFSFELLARFIYFNGTKFQDQQYIDQNNYINLLVDDNYILDIPPMGDSKIVLFDKNQNNEKFIKISFEIFVQNPIENSITIQAFNNGVIEKNSNTTSTLGWQKINITYFSQKFKNNEILITNTTNKKISTEIRNMKVDFFNTKKLSTFLISKGILELTFDSKTLFERNMRTIFNRGEPLDKNLNKKIIFSLGGSTTHGLKASKTSSYPYLTEQIINDNVDNYKVSNYGVVGISSFSTNKFIKDLLVNYSPYLITIHNGYNDLPLIYKKINEDNYEVFTSNSLPFYPLYTNYLQPFFRYNFWQIRNLLFDNLEFISKIIPNENKIFLGYEPSSLTNQIISESEIIKLNNKNTETFIKIEEDTIKFAIKNRIKLLYILEPEIIPNWYPLGTGFRDPKTAEIQKKNHINQQNALYNLLIKYENTGYIYYVDARKLLSKNYKKYFYDELHLNHEGNKVIAELIAKKIKIINSQSSSKFDK